MVNMYFFSMDQPIHIRNFVKYLIFSQFVARPTCFPKSESTTQFCLDVFIRVQKPTSITEHTNNFFDVEEHHNTTIYKNNSKMRVDRLNEINNCIMQLKILYNIISNNNE